MDTTGLRHGLPVIAAGTAITLLLAACTGSADGSRGANSASPAPTASTSQASPAESPTLDQSLTAEEQQAFEEATDVVLAYRQTITDLYSGARTDLNDLDDVATGELLDSDLGGLQKALGEGRRVQPADAQVIVAAAEPLTIHLDSEPPTVVVRACIDATGFTTIEGDGTKYAGIQESLDYTLVKTAYLPEPGWAVSRVAGELQPEDRRC